MTGSLEEYKKILWNKFQESGSPRAESRYRHSLGVLKKALEIKKTFNLPVDEHKLMVAALLHDYAKFTTKEEYAEILKENHLNRQLLETSPKIWHSILGGYVVQKELGINDPEILDAIRDHTLGGSSMSLLSEIIFLADYTDETREGEYFREAKALSKVDFHQAIACKIHQRMVKEPQFVTEELKAMYQKYRED